MVSSRGAPRKPCSYRACVSSLGHRRSSCSLKRRRPSSVRRGGVIGQTLKTLSLPGVRLGSRTLTDRDREGPAAGAHVV